MQNKQQDPNFFKNKIKNSKRNSNSGNELLVPNSLESWTISQN
jgi:hypothetical protein